MISLAALFSFQGTDRPSATRRTSGAPVHETEISSYEKSSHHVKVFLAPKTARTPGFLAAQPPASVFKKIVSR